MQKLPNETASVLLEMQTDYRAAPLKTSANQFHEGFDLQSASGEMFEEMLTW